jgi:hypothetical protein
MRKIQMWSTLKEILSVIDGWDKETFEREKEKDEMTFHKFLPGPADQWNVLDKYVIKIKIYKENFNEQEEDSARKSTQSVEKS